jgi:hypothetical protein
MRPCSIPFTAAAILSALTCQGFGSAASWRRFMPSIVINRDCDSSQPTKALTGQRTPQKEAVQQSVSPDSCAGCLAQTKQ